MKKYNRVLTIQDVSCVGQCSGTVAMPIVSACGQECCIIPSAVLSTHTGGFTGFTFTDLTEDIPAIREHWIKENIKFDFIYTGYLGSNRQIDYVLDIMNSCLDCDGIIIVDPAMADNGKLYSNFDANYVEGMKKLCRKADVVVPNITEASFLTGMEYKADYDQNYVKNLAEKLLELGVKKVVMTGVSYNKDKTGVAILDRTSYAYYEHDYLKTEMKPNGWHGTGDIYASAFVGALANGIDEYRSAQIAADFVVESIRQTIDDDNHWYGVKFERAIPKLIKSLEMK